MKAFFHPDQNLHHPKSYFTRGQMREPQEIPERTTRIIQGLKNLDIPVEKPADHGMRPIANTHNLGYLRFLESAHRRWPADWGEEVLSNIFVQHPNAQKGILAEAGRYLADGSSPIGEHTWKAAYASAQSAIAAAQALIDGERYAYGLSRPPGHHATTSSAGGFCFLNNAAIAANVLKPHFPRVAVLDPDVHHGQGVQQVFYDRDDVLYISIHGDPTNFYPVASGYEEERGEGMGLGYNINLPMPQGSPEETFFEKLDEAMRAIHLFSADVLVIALGFDLYKDDPQAQVAVTTEGFRRLGSLLRGSNLPIAVIQEGGYHLESLTQNTEAFFSGLLE